VNHAGGDPGNEQAAGEGHSPKMTPRHDYIRASVASGGKYVTPLSVLARGDQPEKAFEALRAEAVPLSESLGLRLVGKREH